MMMNNKNIFGRFAKLIASVAGSPPAFIIALSVIVIWIITGPMFGYSDTWQLIINTGTTVVTFLMVFIIQNSQNKDTTAIQLKLDELIRATDGAHNALMNLEELSDNELKRIRDRYLHLAIKAQESLRKGEVDTNKPEVGEDFDIS